MTKKKQKWIASVLASRLGRCEALAVLDDDAVVVVTALPLGDDSVAARAEDRRRLVLKVIRGARVDEIAGLGDLVVDWRSGGVALLRVGKGVVLAVINNDPESGFLVELDEKAAVVRQLVIPSWPEQTSGLRVIALGLEPGVALVALPNGAGWNDQSIHRLDWRTGSALLSAYASPLGTDDHPTSNEHYARGYFHAMSRVADRIFFVAGRGRPSPKAGWCHLLELDQTVGRRFLAHVPEGWSCYADRGNFAFEDRKTGKVQVTDCTGALVAVGKRPENAFALAGIHDGSLYFFGSDGTIVKVALGIATPSALPPRPASLPELHRSFGEQPAAELAKYSAQPTYCDPKHPAPAVAWHGIIGWLLDEDPSHCEPSVTHVSIGEDLLDFHRLEHDHLVLAFNFGARNTVDVKMSAPHGNERASIPPGAVRFEVLTRSGRTVFLAMPALYELLAKYRVGRGA